MEGHWTYALTEVLVRRVSLRLLNLDCRYPRDLLQPAREKKKKRLGVNTLNAPLAELVPGYQLRWPGGLLERRGRLHKRGEHAKSPEQKRRS